MNLNSGTVVYNACSYWCVDVLFEDLNVTSFIHSEDMNQFYFPTRLLVWTWLEVQWSQCIDLISTLVHLAKFRNVFICRAPVEFHRKEADGYFWRFEMKIMLSVDKNGKIDTFLLLIWILMNIRLVRFWRLVISFHFFDITGEH